MSAATSITLPLPPHLEECNARLQGTTMDVEAVMRSLIEFGHTHIKTQCGGPFVAAIQECSTNSILVVGANLVTYWNQSWAHAERVTLALAQQLLGNYSLPKDTYRLLTTSQMCIACYGEALSSGLVEVVASATAADVEELTPFKEGVLPQEWVAHLRAQGITYRPECEREKGRELLKAYGKEGLNYFNAG